MQNDADVARETRITTPAGLTQKYVFIPSQVREVYLVYLLLNLCSLTGAKPLHSTPASTTTTPVSKRGNPKKRASDKDDEAVPVLPQTILFVPHCRTAALLAELFSSLPTPIPCTSLHSHLSQPDRLRSLSTFRRHAVPLLIATDVGSRGLDIPEVAVVVNWEVPRVPDDYIHRVGRTARAGRTGTSITFVTEGDVELVKVLEERIGTDSGPSPSIAPRSLLTRNGGDIARRHATDRARVAGRARVGIVELGFDREAHGQHGASSPVSHLGSGH